MYQISTNFTITHQISPYFTKLHHSSLNRTKSHQISPYLTKTKCQSRTSCGTILWGKRGGERDVGFSFSKPPPHTIFEKILPHEPHFICHTLDSHLTSMIIKLLQKKNEHTAKPVSPNLIASHQISPYLTKTICQSRASAFFKILF